MFQKTSFLKANMALHLITLHVHVDESIHTDLDSDSDSSEESGSPLPRSRGATVKFKKVIACSNSNLGGGMLITACNYTR